MCIRTPNKSTARECLRRLIKYAKIISGKVAEWLKALVLKTRDGNIRRFESCPFRHDGRKNPLSTGIFSDRFSSVDACACRCVCDYCCDFVLQQVSL